MVKKLNTILFKGLLAIGLLVGSQSGLAAQKLLVPSPGSPDGSGTRGAFPTRELPKEQSITSGPNTLEPIPEPIISGELDSGQGLFGSDLEMQIFDYQPALLESTGTWLRRGFWYSEVDVLMMDRIWRRDNFNLATQDFTNNALLVEGGRTGAEATPRLNIGRFLFRDHKNRDHAIEFIAFGGGQWSQSGRLDAVGDGTLNVGSYSNGILAPNNPIDQGNPSFDGATAMQYDYNSRFNNFELNYHVKSRMLKDRMELEPSGHWVRRAQPSISRSLIAGIRYFDLNEDFNWDAFGMTDTNGDIQSGNYRVKTDNDMIGTQIGFTWNYETARWSLGLANKSGMYLNHTDVESNFAVTGGGASGNNDSSVDNLSFITEASVIGKWHLMPNFSLRAGLEILYVSSVAHASEQLNFIPVSSGQSAIVNGDSTFMGGTFGFERYW